MNRRSFFSRLVKAAAIIALAPKIAFHKPWADGGYIEFQKYMTGVGYDVFKVFPALVVKDIISMNLPEARVYYKDIVVSKIIQISDSENPSKV